MNDKIRDNDLTLHRTLNKAYETVTAANGDNWERLSILQRGTLVCEEAERTLRRAHRESPVAVAEQQARARNDAARWVAEAETWFFNCTLTDGGCRDSYKPNFIVQILRGHAKQSAIWLTGQFPGLTLINANSLVKEVEESFYANEDLRSRDGE